MPSKASLEVPEDIDEDKDEDKDSGSLTESDDSPKRIITEIMSGDRV
tara:strand:+ start:304 stop:444 length:141 start_codon:yes stop_codon:yes gene_type:complete